MIRQRQILINKHIMALVFLLLIVNVPSEATSGTIQARSTLPFSPIDPIDKKLLYFDKIAGGYPPDIKNNDEYAKIIKEWNKIELKLLAKSKMEGESFDTELKLGHLYRYGHNLNIKDAWENSNSHFRKTIELAPSSVDAYIGLGVLYVNSDFKYATQSEYLFKKAIVLSRGQRIPKEAIFGLFFSYYYQGRLVDAIKVADNYIDENPNEVEMHRLREITQSALNRAK